MKFSALKRIVSEDFDPKDKEFILRLANIFNPMVDQLTNAFNNGLDFYNLAQSAKQITLSVNESGIVVGAPTISTDLKTKCRGIVCLRAQNQNSPYLFVNSAPFISFSENEKIITITHVSGLIPNNTYLLDLVFYS